MKRKIVLGTILGFSAIIVIAAALFLPSLAQSDQVTSSVDQNVPTVVNSSQTADPTFNSTISLYGGSVILQLPPGGGALASRPIDLQILVFHIYTGAGTFFGPSDEMRILLWVPTSNAYVPVAQISNNHSPGFDPWLSAVVGVSPLAKNHIVVSGSPDPLEVGMSGDLVIANLTVPVNISIGDPFPPYLKALNFTLPPIAIELRPTGSAFQDYATSVTPASWTLQTSMWSEPSFARVWIPQWLGATAWNADGTITLDETVTYYSP